MSSIKQVYRHEIKYLISILDFYTLKKRVECILKLDKNSGKSGYIVRSLYFDTIGDNDLLDVIDGNMDKKKIRLRTYPKNSDEVWLEIKYKSDRDINKHSIKLSKSEVKKMMTSDYGFLIDRKEEIAKRIYSYLKLDGYIPKVIVSYNRLAYEYPVSNTRITFDQNISASYVVDSFLDKSLSLSSIVAQDLGVLEVKYDSLLVGVIKDILKNIDELNQANSKYAQSRFLL